MVYSNLNLSHLLDIPLFKMAFVVFEFIISYLQIFQFYNAYVLFRLSFHEDCVEWQVTEISLLNKFFMKMLLSLMFINSSR